MTQEEQQLLRDIIRAEFKGVFPEPLMMFEFRIQNIVETYHQAKEQAKEGKEATLCEHKLRDMAKAEFLPCEICGQPKPIKEVKEVEKSCENCVNKPFSYSHKPCRSCDEDYSNFKPINP